MNYKSDIPCKNCGGKDVNYNFWLTIGNSGCDATIKCKNCGREVRMASLYSDDITLEKVSEYWNKVNSNDK